MQVPGVALQVWQTPAHADSQQKPSTHLPEEQVSPVPHPEPIGSVVTISGWPWLSTPLTTTQAQCGPGSAVAGKAILLGQGAEFLVILPLSRRVSG